MNFWLVTRRKGTLVLIYASFALASCAMVVIATYYYSGPVPLWVEIAYFGVQIAVSQYAALIKRKRRRLGERIARSRSRNALR